MKRFLLLLFVIVICSGCGSQEEESKDSDTVQEDVEIIPEEKAKEKEETDNSQVNQDKAEEQEEEEWIPISINDAPEDYNCEFCLGCGRTNSELTVTKWGYCNSCFEQFRPFGSCAVCGSALDGSDTAHYDGTRCYTCASRCDYCGGELEEGTFESTGAYADSLCYARYVTGCLNCGVKNDTVDASTGLCYDCMYSSGAYDICPVCGAEYQNNNGDGMCLDCANAQ